MKKKNILIATMALGIGGAETHVVELSKKLMQKGHKVVIASNGGVFEKEIALFGIKHIKVSLHTKNPYHLIKSYRHLKKIVIRESIDIVHAHARIPAFLCNMLCKRYNVPFVTTIHAEFRTSFLFKTFTRWGSYTLSVSKDINEYLMDNYDYDNERASLTVNGINETVFFPKPPDEKLLSELNIRENNYVVTTICRLDKSSSKTPSLLLEIAIELNKNIPKLKILIAGHGTMYEKLREKAASVNKKCGREVVVMTGSRSDVDKILSVTDVFTGISRAALEAMAMKKPTILCGDFGYMGIMSNKNKEYAIETNMTCRGMDESTGTKLYTDLLKLYNQKELREQNAQLNYKTVKEYYSADKMAEDAIHMYEKALIEKKSPPTYYHAVVSGYYGFDNSGDEALLASILYDLKQKKEDIRLIVLSKRPNETKSTYGVDSIGRANPLAIFKLFGKTGMLISGGGNLIQDLTSFQSMLYYTGLMNYAKYRGLKVMLYANGIGPLKRKASICIAGKVLNKTDVITVREKNSYELLKNIGVIKPVISITADPVMSFKKPDEKHIEQTLKKHGIDKQRKIVAFSVRPWKGLESGFVVQFAETADYIFEKYGMLPVFVPMNTKKDTKISEEIIQIMKHPAMIIKDEKSAMNLISIISKAEMLIGMRLHSLIYAAITETPGIGIVYDPKVRYVIEMMEQIDGGLIENIKAENIMGMIDHMMDNREVFIENCKRNMIGLRKLSAENAKIAVDLLEKGI